MNTLSYKTVSANKATVNKEWVIIDAEGKVLYVWFDAPIGYISATRELTPEWEKYWKDPETRMIHFIGKDNIGKNRPRNKLELPVFIQNFRAYDIGRHQVGRELDAAEGEVEGVGQGVDEQGLGQPGHAHKQAVAPREDRDQQSLQLEAAGLLGLCIVALHQRGRR